MDTSEYIIIIEENFIQVKDFICKMKPQEDIDMSLLLLSPVLGLPSLLKCHIVKHRPGSLIYLVWAQNRENYDRPGIYNLKNDIQSLLNEDSDNIFLIKLTYLFTLR